MLVHRLSCPKHSPHHTVQKLHIPPLDQLYVESESGLGECPVSGMVRAPEHLHCFSRRPNLSYLKKPRHCFFFFLLSSIRCLFFLLLSFVLFCFPRNATLDRGADLKFTESGLTSLCSCLHLPSTEITACTTMPGLRSHFSFLAFSRDFLPGASPASEEFH